MAPQRPPVSRRPFCFGHQLQGDKMGHDESGSQRPCWRLEITGNHKGRQSGVKPPALQDAVALIDRARRSAPSVSMYQCREASWSACGSTPLSPAVSSCNYPANFTISQTFIARNHAINLPRSCLSTHPKLFLEEDARHRLQRRHPPQSSLVVPLLPPYGVTITTR